MVVGVCQDQLFFKLFEFERQRSNVIGFKFSKSLNVHSLTYLPYIGCAFHPFGFLSQ